MAGDLPDGVPGGVDLPGQGGGRAQGQVVQEPWNTISLLVTKQAGASSGRNMPEGR